MELSNNTETPALRHMSSSRESHSRVTIKVVEDGLDSHHDSLSDKATQTVLPDADVEQDAIDDGPALSETSTVEYEHESFTTFRAKVLLLCKQLWPEAESFDIDRLQGGNYNRVIAITVHPSRNRPGLLSLFYGLFEKIVRPRGAGSLPYTLDLPSRYILRIPRHTWSRIDYDSAILQLVSSNTSIPVPRVIHMDTTTENPIGERYVLQERLPGTSLVYLYDAMNAEQRVSVARQVGKIWLELQKLKFKSAGEVSPNAKDILRFQVRLLCDDSEDLGPEPVAEQQSVREWFVDQMYRRQGLMEPSLDSRPWWKWIELADAINQEKHFFDQSSFFLYHGDLEARNILVEIVDFDTVRITGVLDWDEAKVGPQIMGCLPPSWLWRWNGYFEDQQTDSIEANANLAPEADEEKAIKTAFEDTVGPEFKRMGYSEESLMMRLLCAYAMEGVHNVSSIKNGIKLLQRWHFKHNTVDDELEKIFSEWDTVVDTNGSKIRGDGTYPDDMEDEGRDGEENTEKL